jgi:hypothetical protein
LQLVNKQVNIEGDGILGKDFLLRRRAQICYESKSVNFNWNNFSFKKYLTSESHTENESRESRTIILQQRSETMVRIPVDYEKNQTEGIIEKCELNKGIFVANSLTMVKNGYVITSILNTNNHEVVLPEPRLRLGRIESVPIGKERVR